MFSDRYRSGTDTDLSQTLLKLIALVRTFAHAIRIASEISDRLDVSEILVFGSPPHLSTKSSNKFD